MKEWIYSYALKNKQKKEKRVPHSISLKEASRILLLYDHDHQQIERIDFNQQFSSDQDLYLLGVSSRKINQEHTTHHCVASNEDFSFFLGLKNKSLQNYLSQPFDLLVNLTDHYTHSVAMLVLSCASKYKVSTHKAYIDVSDFIVHTNDTSTEQRIQSVSKYLNKVI